MADATTISVLIKARDEASKAFKNVEHNAGQMAQGIAKHRRAIGMAMTGMGAAITGFAVMSVKAASTLEESMNAVNVVFADGAKTIHAFGEDSAKSVGMSTAAFNQMATVTGALLKDVGLPMSEVAGMTNDLAIRAADMASVFDTDVKDAMSAINQALRGETEAIRRYAGDVTDATLQTFLLSQGINTQVSEMTQQEKRLERVNLIMSQTNTMAGDFANTSDSLANRMRIAKAEFANVSAELGTALLPMVTAMVEKIQVAIEVVADWIKEHPELAKKLMIAAAAVGALMLVLGPLLLILPGLTIAFGLLMTVGLGPIGVAIALITASIMIAIKVWKNWDTIIEVVKKGIALFVRSAINYIKIWLEGAKAIVSWIPGLDSVESKIGDAIKTLDGFSDSVDGWASNSEKKVKETGQAWSAMEDGHHSTSGAVITQNAKMSQSTNQVAAITQESTKNIVHGWGAVEDAVMEVAIKQKESLDAQAAEQTRHDALMKISRESSQSLYRQELAEFVEGNLAKQEALAHTSASWDSFRENQDATMIKLTEASMSFGDVVDQLALTHEGGWGKMVDDMVAGGVAWGDTMALIELVGRDSIARVVDDFGNIKPALDQALGAMDGSRATSMAAYAGADVLPVGSSFDSSGWNKFSAEQQANARMDWSGMSDQQLRSIQQSSSQEAVKWAASQERFKRNTATSSFRPGNILTAESDSWGTFEAAKLAKGGIVTRPTLGLVGEAGPEAVIPLGRGGGMGTTNNFHFHGAVYGVEDLKEAVVEAVRDHAISGGFSGVFAEA
tara:strand:- start:199 stop:2562 length:2364 start_codon:yes stop_codon:yes gene_type:complete